jgi:HSP20 family protein
MDKALNKAFQEFAKDFDLPAFSSPDRSTPEFKVKDNNTNYVVTANIPGMKLDDFNLSVKGNQLTISSAGANITEEEASYGKISQGITFSEPIDKEGIEKKYEQGKLKIEIPKVAKQLSH